MKKAITFVLCIMMLGICFISCKQETTAPKTKNQHFFYGEEYNNGINGEYDGSRFGSDDSSEAVYKDADINASINSYFPKGDYDFASATCSYTIDSKIYFGGYVQKKGGNPKVCYWDYGESDYVLHICNESDELVNADPVAIAVDANGKVYIAVNSYGMGYEPGYYDGSTWKKLTGVTGTAFPTTPNNLVKYFQIPYGGMGFSPDGKLLVIAVCMGQTSDTSPHYSRPGYWLDGTFHALYAGDGIESVSDWVYGYAYVNGVIKVYGNKQEEGGYQTHMGYFLDQGTLPNFTQIDATVSQCGNGFYQNGDDFYLLGSEDLKDGYWKNAVFTEVANSMIKNIYVDSKGIYMVGQSKINGELVEGSWKNGTFTSNIDATNKKLTLNGIGYKVVPDDEVIN